MSDWGRFEHLKLRALPGEFKYVLFEDMKAFERQVRGLLASSTVTGAPICIVTGDEEYSAILPSDVPVSNVKEEAGWFCLRILGEMPFGTVQGLIAKISFQLANNGIGICVISSFKTDYFFVRQKNRIRAMSILQSSGWSVEE